MGKTPTNPEIIAAIHRGFRLEKRPSHSGINFNMSFVSDEMKAASAVLSAAVSTQLTTMLFHGSEQAYREETAVQCLMHHWEMTRDELDGRLQQIADANPGDWFDKSAHRVWAYVLAGMTFDSNGRLELEKHPMFKPRFDYSPKFEFKTRFGS